MSDLNTIILAFATALAITSYRMHKNGIEGDELERIFFITLSTSLIMLIIK